ncbi:Leukocyte elastase inhibitor-like [Arapaima gigas]
MCEYLESLRWGSLSLQKSENSEDMADFSSANTQFALELLRILNDTNPDKNIFISPLSITSALAMVYLGARGNTATQMSKALCLRPNTDIHKDIQLFLSDINNPSAPYQLKLANRLYGEKTYSFLQEYLDATQKFYYAALEAVDFKGAPEKTVLQINHWVEEQTNGKIKNILQPGAVDSQTRLALVNSIYFKGQWHSVFFESNTKEKPFKINQHESKLVQMMYQDQKFPYSYVPEYNLQILELPYESGDLSMVILLPEEAKNGSNPLQKLEKELTIEKINEWTKKEKMKSYKDIYVYLPKFKLEESYDLIPPLRSLGITDVFNDHLADLSGINGQKDLFVSTVAHKTFINVDEIGTEAAASTAMVSKVLCYGGSENFNADHPFLFFIRHNKSKTILFLGRVSSP